MEGSTGFSLRTVMEGKDKRYFYYQGFTATAWVQKGEKITYVIETSTEFPKCDNIKTVIVFDVPAACKKTIKTYIKKISTDKIQLSWTAIRGAKTYGVYTSKGGAAPVPFYDRIRFGNSWSTSATSLTLSIKPNAVY